MLSSHSSYVFISTESSHDKTSIRSNILTLWNLVTRLLSATFLPREAAVRQTLVYTFSLATHRSKYPRLFSDPDTGVQNGRVPKLQLYSRALESTGKPGYLGRRGRHSSFCLKILKLTSSLGSCRLRSFGLSHPALLRDILSPRPRKCF